MTAENITQPVALDAQLKRWMDAFDSRMKQIHLARRWIPPGPIENEVDAWLCVNVPEVFCLDLSIEWSLKCH